MASMESLRTGEQRFHTSISLLISPQNYSPDQLQRRKPSIAMNRDLQLIHSLLGTALGDSLGLPSEGMSRSRIAKRWKGPLEQRFLFGRGMLSDDTEHTILSAQALLLCGGD